MRLWLGGRSDKTCKGAYHVKKETYIAATHCSWNPYPIFDTYKKNSSFHNLLELKKTASGTTLLF